MPMRSMTKPFGSVGVRGQTSQNKRESEPQAFDSPEAAVAAAYAEYDKDHSRALAQMTDYQSLPPSVLGGAIGEYRRDRANRP